MYLAKLALTFVLLAMAGCQATVDPGGVRIEGPSLTLGDNHQSQRSGSGKFCPPGQAKKGNC